MSQPPTSLDVPDDLDRTLADFFKGQLPSTWPACRATAAVEPARTRLAGELPWASRTALAVSLALLLGLGFYFSGGTGTNPPRSAGSNNPLLPGATADGAGLLQSASPVEKAHDPLKNLPPMPMP